MSAELEPVQREEARRTVRDGRLRDPPAAGPAARERLLHVCAGYPSAVVGFSAGVDSTVVLWALLRARGPANVLAVTACSPTFPERELADARRLAARLRAPHLVVSSDEMANESFRNNPSDRCYFCKSELYAKLRELADRRGLALVADGTNLDDQGDYRPGLRAGVEWGVRSPLREARLTKADVRAVARTADLPNAEKPAFACLSSRIPYGEVITVEKLARVGAAEDALRELGFGQLRVRHHGEVARIEVPPADFGRALELAPRIVAALRAAGYLHVALDLAGYRPGSLNAALGPTQVVGGREAAAGSKIEPVGGRREPAAGPPGEPMVAFSASGWSPAPARKTPPDVES